MARAKKEKEEIQAEEQAAESQTQAQDAAPESITLNDLQVLVQIVDLASSRGAFRGSELTQVGTTFDKVTRFLRYVSEQQQRASEAQNETAGG